MERGLRWLLVLDDPDHELVFGDNRSDDGTGEIVDRVDAGDDRPKVVRLGGRSAGGFGKNHACWRGPRGRGRNCSCSPTGRRWPGARPSGAGCPISCRSPRARGVTGIVSRPRLSLAVFGGRDSRHCSHNRVAVRVDESTPAHRRNGRRSDEGPIGGRTSQRVLRCPRLASQFPAPILSRGPEIRVACHSEADPSCRCGGNS